METLHIDTKLKILIVDNDKDRVRSLKTMLKNLDYRLVDEISDYERAVSLLDEESGYRMVLLNWDMPDGVATKFVEEARKGPLKDVVRIVMQTDRSDQETIMNAVKAGVNRCIIKPVLPKNIEHELIKLMELGLAAAKKNMEAEIARIKKEMLSVELEKESLKSACHEGAIEMLEAAEFYPWRPYLHYEIALAYQEAGMLSSAVTSLEKALHLDATHKKACHSLAGIYLQRKQWYKAIRLLVPFVVQKPFPDLLELLGEAYLAVGETNKAIKAFNDSIFYSRETTTTSKRELAKKHEGLGKAYQEKANETEDPNWKERSINSFEESIQVDPSLVSAHFNLMQAYKQAGQPEKAAQVLKNAASVTPDDSDGWVSLGSMYLEEDAPDKASFAFKRAIQVSDSPQQTFYDIAENYVDHDIEISIRFLKRSVQLDPEQPHVWNKLAIINRKKGLVDEALEQYKRAIELDPDDEIIHFNCARAYLDKNEGNARNEAIQHLMEALRLRPDFPEVKAILDKLK